MNQVKAKIYYLISNGEVLIITSEMQGCVEETTKEQDMKFYQQLKDKSIDEVDFIELEYGTLASTFNNVKSYSVDVENKKLITIKYTQEDLDAIAQQNIYEQALSNRLNTVSDYISQNKDIIDDLEIIIIQHELNNIENGVV